MLTAFSYELFLSYEMESFDFPDLLDPNEFNLIWSLWALILYILLRIIYCKDWAFFIFSKSETSELSSYNSYFYL